MVTYHFEQWDSYILHTNRLKSWYTPTTVTTQRRGDSGPCCKLDSILQTIRSHNNISPIDIIASSKLTQQFPIHFTNYPSLKIEIQIDKVPFLIVYLNDAKKENSPTIYR